MNKTHIFVFGSNLAGRHGKGAALYAKRNHGAIYGQAYGLQGLSFAIPTKDLSLRPLPLDQIEYFVNLFLRFAKENQQYNFNLTRIGCGLAGYKDSQIAPMFHTAPNNVNQPPEWK